MIQFIVGGLAVTAGAVAVQGAACSVVRGFVRGVGRVAEGDPVKGFGEILGGFLEPFAIAGTQMLNLFVDTINVTVYSGAKLVSILSPETRAMLEKIGGFDNTLAGLIIAASMPDTSDAKAPVPATDPRFIAALDEALKAGKTEFELDGVKYKAMKAPAGAPMAA